MTGDDAFAEGTTMLEQGRHAIALEHFSAAAGSSEDAELRLAAMAHAATLNLTLGRPHEALVWIELLREEAPTTDQADLLAAQAETRLGNGEEALALLERVRSPDTAHFSYEPSFVPLLRCEALASAGRVDEAVSSTLTQIAGDPASPGLWRLLARLLDGEDGATVDISAAVDGLPEASLSSATAGLVDAPIGGAQRVVDALWRRWPGDRRLLALLATIGHRLPVPSALEWSGRMRGAGHGEHCPLLGLAASPDRHPRERVRAAAAAGRTFSDERAAGLLELATTAVVDDELAEAFEEVLALAPDLAESFVVAAAQTPRRALLVAGALDASGNVEPAVALARHAVELTTGQPDEWRAAVAAAFDDVEPFAAKAQAVGADELAAALRKAG